MWSRRSLFKMAAWAGVTTLAVLCCGCVGVSGDGRASAQAGSDDVDWYGEYIVATVGSRGAHLVDNSEDSYLGGYRLPFSGMENPDIGAEPGDLVAVGGENVRVLTSAPAIFDGVTRWKIVQKHYCEDTQARRELESGASPRAGEIPPDLEDGAR